MSLLRRRMMMLKQITTENLPIEYRRISYLESQGNQYIKTGFIPQAGAGMFAEYEITDNYAQSRYYMVGCYLSNNRFQFSPSDPAFFGYGQIYNSTVSIGRIGGKRKAQIINGQFFVDGNLIYSSNSTILNNVNEAYLFALNANESLSSLSTNLRIYSLKLLHGDEVECDFVPALRLNDNKPGLYDHVTKEFYTNAGTGEFIWE